MQRADLMEVIFHNYITARAHLLFNGYNVLKSPNYQSC